MQGSGYYALWGKPSGQADTYCMVNVFLQRHSKRGYESIWIYPVCCDYVWTGMHAAFDSGICIQTAGWCDGICFHQVSPTDEVQIVVFGVFWRAAWCHHVWTSFVDGWERFRGEQHFWRMCFFFGRWWWEWCFWKSFGICFASHDVFARQQQLPNCTLFQTVFAWWFFWRRFWREAFIFWTGVFLQNTGKMHLQHMQMHVDVDEFIFVYLLQLEFATNSGEQCACMHVPGSSMLHDRITETRTTLHSGRQSQDKLPLLVFVCCEKKVRARSSENLWVFDLGVFASCIHRHRRLGSDPTRRNGVRERRG